MNISTQYLFPKADSQPRALANNPVDLRWNPGLTDRKIEQTKLEFLEGTIRPLLPDHNLFRSEAYLKYKEWVENGGILPLSLLAAKRVVETGTFEMADQLQQTPFYFGRQILDAVLVKKVVSSNKTFTGLFPCSASPVGNNLLLGILTTSSGVNIIKEAGFCQFVNNEIYFTDYLTVQEEVTTNSSCIRLYGAKALIPYFGSMFRGKVTREELLSKNQPLKRRFTGTWGDRGNGIWGLTGPATEEYIDSDGKVTHKFTGTWGDRRNGIWRLTGPATLEVIVPDRKVTRKFTGTWGDRGNGIWGLTGPATQEEIGPDGKVTSKLTGNQEDLGSGNVVLKEGQPAQASMDLAELTNTPPSRAPNKRPRQT